jgi:DNA repair exonuclease SbcCD ATPase subunit
MNIKPIIGLMLAAVLGVALADEPYDQLKSQIQKVEKRADGLEKSIKQAQDSTSELKKQFGELAASGKLQQQKLSELNVKLNVLEGRQTTLGGSLDQLSRDTEQKTQTIDETIMSRSKWYGAAIAALLLLLGGCYWYLRRRNDASEQSLTAQVKSAMETVRSTEEKIAKSDTALADSLFEILNKLKVQEMSASANGQSKPAEVDHNLPLKLADEIHRMRKRLASLPEDTKGLTPLQKSLERLESELSEQGYEIVDHTGMAYTENLSVKARFVPSDDLGPDQKIISKVVTPQVNYKGVMIRMADIEVSIGS